MVNWVAHPPTIAPLRLLTSRLCLRSMTAFGDRPSEGSIVERPFKTFKTDWVDQRSPAGDAELVL